MHSDPDSDQAAAESNRCAVNLNAGQSYQTSTDSDANQGPQSHEQRANQNQTPIQDPTQKPQDPTWMLSAIRVTNPLPEHFCSTTLALTFEAQHPHEQAQHYLAQVKEIVAETRNLVNDKPGDDYKIYTPRR